MNFVAPFIYVVRSTTEEKNAILVSITSRKMGNSRSPSCINPALPGLLKTRWTWGRGGGGAPPLTRLFLIVEA